MRVEHNASWHYANRVALETQFITPEVKVAFTVAIHTTCFVDRRFDVQHLESRKDLAYMKCINNNDNNNNKNNDNDNDNGIDVWRVSS